MPPDRINELSKNLWWKTVYSGSPREPEPSYSSDKSCEESYKDGETPCVGWGSFKCLPR